MIGSIFRGKPDAGDPHIRFDKAVLAAVIGLSVALAAGAGDLLVVGCESTMVGVRPKEGVEVRPVESFAVRLARNEKEGFQMLVKPSVDLKDVKVGVGDLVRDGGGSAGPGEATFPAADIDCDVVGYAMAHFPTNSSQDDCSDCCTAINEKSDRPPYYRRRNVRATEGWWPDPILDFCDGVEIAKGDVQSFWIRVRCPETRAAGTYRGVLTLSAMTANGDALRRTFPLAVRVYGFTLPRQSPLPLAITWSPMSHAECETPESWAAANATAEDPDGPVLLAKANVREWGDFLADYWITMDSLYTRTNLHWEVLEKLRDEGRLGRFNLGYWGYFKDGANAEAEWRAETLPRLRRNYEKAKALGILDKAYLYGCDEVNTNFFDNIRRCVGVLKSEFPGVPISTTSFDDEFGVGTKLDVIDWFTPLTPKYDIAKAMRSRAEGHQVWWYICCGPGNPWANMFTQCKPLDARMLMGAQTVRMRPDGFLFYEISIWNARRPIEKGPYTDWVARSFLTFNGDGCWTAVGKGGHPLPTLRLENFRDGLEDYAYALALERKVTANPGWSRVDEAKRLLAVPSLVMESMVNFTDDPNAVMAWRDAMAELIEAPVR